MTPVIAALFCVVRAAPLGDVEVLMARPTPRAFIRLVADVAGCVPLPGAQIAGVALGILAAGTPSNHPLRDGQTSLGRGGRRWGAS